MATTKIEKQFMFHVWAITGIVDGDTFNVELDMGLNIRYLATVRILGIDTPELHSKNPLEVAAAKTASICVDNWIMARKPPLGGTRGAGLVVYSKEWEKYGRILGDLMTQRAYDRRDDPEARVVYANEALSTWMLKNGLARAYSGDAKKPWTEAELQAITVVKPTY
jgi:endonuclease YncB( thermonuclease family)